MHDVKEMTHQEVLNELLHIMSPVNVFFFESRSTPINFGGRAAVRCCWSIVISAAIDQHTKKKNSPIRLIDRTKINILFIINDTWYLDRLLF